MGSLPNLHELSRSDERAVLGQGVYKCGPVLGRLCGAYDAGLSGAEKSRILHRYSGHAKVKEVRSNPNDFHKIVQDDNMIEHMAAYSPVSSQSRCNLPCGVPIRRIDSLASSIGATSVRRLLTVVRGGGRSSVGRPVGIAYSRKVLIANLACICICHLLATSAFLPFMSLQSSVSIWVQPSGNNGFEINIGSLLNSETFLAAAMTALIAPYLIKIIGISLIIAICYGGMTIFYTSHLYPVIYVTIPTSLLLGILLGLLSTAHISFLMILTHRIAGSFHEDDEESKNARRTCVIRRIARTFQGAHDLGLILGSVFSFLVIHFTINMRSESQSFEFKNGTIISNDCFSNETVSNCLKSTQSPVMSASTPYDYNSFLDDIFDRNEEGRLCGAKACPILIADNSTLHSGFRILPLVSTKLLIAIYGSCCGVAFLFGALGLDSITTMMVYHEAPDRNLVFVAFRAIKGSFKDPRMQLAAPLAFFVGLEQAFIYADFSKSYVVCTLGIHRINLVFLAMGLLQSIAACTLSMLLRTIRRYYVVAVGFSFQICLIMVLLLWKPNEDDPALFYVISAAWGVCHAIWEMMSFTLLTGQYLDHWEAAFANQAFFKFIGFSLSFTLHSFLCNDIKLYILASVMVMSVIPFALLEYKLENIRKIRNMTRL